MAHTDPYKNHLTDTVIVDGKKKDVVTPDGVPIGPTWQGEFFLGADGNGRDTAVRLLYGGRNSLLIGMSAALITTLLVDDRRDPLRLLPRLHRHGDLARRST